MKLEETLNDEALEVFECTVISSFSDILSCLHILVIGQLPLSRNAHLDFNGSKLEQESMLMLIIVMSLCFKPPHA